MPREARVWWNSQKGSWCTDIGGRRRSLAKGKDNKKLAKERLKTLLEEQALLVQVDGAITVACLCERFLDFAQENLEPGTYASYKYSCQKFIDHFAERFAHTITTQDLSQFLNKLKPKLGDTSRGIVLRSVVRCFHWGAEQDLIPPIRWKKIHFPKSKRRDRYLTDSEFQAMLRATNPVNNHRTGAQFRRLLLAMDWTLCRPGELVQLQWGQIHWDQKVAILERHKTSRTGKPKIIPLVPKMVRLLKWLKRHGRSHHCFVNSRGKPWNIRSINHRMAHIRKRAGLIDVMPYTVRHRAATNAIIKTGDLKMTSLLLGHTSTTTTERYLHLAQQHLVDFATKAVG